MNSNNNFSFARLFFAQIFGALTVIVFSALVSTPLDSLLLPYALLQGAIAACVSRFRREPPWWAVIHLCFLPLIVVTQPLAIAPSVWLAGFVLLFLIYWRTDQSRVPLYLTNNTTSQFVAQQIPGAPSCVIDLGCGSGGLLLRLADARPDCTFVGLEHAPLTFLFAWLRCHRHRNITIRWASFWGHSLQSYDLVYAFLSPAPMARLWEKAEAEMKPAAWLVSNSFAVPEHDPQQVIHVPDGRKTLLFCYQPRQAPAPEKKRHDCPAA